MRCGQFGRMEVHVLPLALRRFRTLDVLGFIGTLTILFSLVGASRAETAVVPFTRAVGPHLFVAEQYDIAGTETQAVSFPIVNGVVQANVDEVYNLLPAQLAARPNGDLLVSEGYADLGTLSPLNGKLLSNLVFQPVASSFFPSPTEFHVDAAGRIYVAFEYSGSPSYNAALAIYRPGASGKDPPYAIVPLPHNDLAFGIATLGRAVYVSDMAGGAINVFAPVERPRLVGTITGFQKPEGLAFDADGVLYVCDAGSGTILALPPTQRGRVQPSRVIFVKGHRLCTSLASFYANGNEMTVAGHRIFAAMDNAHRAVELAANINGPQKPLATISLPQGRKPWQGLDFAVGPR